jgi:hypothetical protein
MVVEFLFISRYSLLIFIVNRMKKYPSVKAIILHEETPTEDPRQEHSRWILANWLKERRRVMPFYMCVAFEDFTFSISCHHACYITKGWVSSHLIFKNFR